ARDYRSTGGSSVCSYLPETASKSILFDGPAGSAIACKGTLALTSHRHLSDCKNVREPVVRSISRTIVRTMRGIVLLTLSAQVVLAQESHPMPPPPPPS